MLIRIFFNNVGFKRDFLVLDNLPFVLGADFISESDLILDLSKGCCYFSFLLSAKIYFHNQEILCALQGVQSGQQHQLNYLLSQFPDVMTDKVG